MRAGGCTVQQALTTEAATVVKQAVTLARRRGHAQVTPLHVANTMLSSSTGLLRTACLQSHSHPLQCKALELCFNVALNRLPASTSSPMLPTQQYPSISNALVAAFKRAQAHQRRGSVENQQQPLLTVKIEVEQLIISILDDPSVSRVMREAGFSSTQVKSNVEQAVSLEICSQNNPVITNTKSKESNIRPSASPTTTSITLDSSVSNEDVKSVIENLMNYRRKKSIVIVGECLSTIEGVVNGVMDKIVKGDVPEELREVKFIPFPLGHLCSRVEVDQKLEDLKVIIRSYLSKGVVLNLGDLKWVIEYRANNNNNNNLCPMEHMIMEIGRLASEIIENNGKFWLMGIATFQTFMKCKSGYPSLETIWGLHTLTIPAGSLSLSLIADSDVQSRSTSKKIDQNGSRCWIILEGEEHKELNCCVDCTSKFENEARTLQSSASTTTSNLPAWLQQYKNETKGPNCNNDKGCVSIKDLCKKWNSICCSIHHKPYSYEKTITFASISPSSSTSGFSYDHQYPNLHQTHHDWPMVEPKQSWRSDHQFWVGSESVSKISSCISTEPSLKMYIPEHHHQPNPTLPFLSNPNSSTPNSTSSSDLMETDHQYFHKFKEMNAENLKILCNALENKVPWQKDVIPEIASTILQCRSGMVKRKGKCHDHHQAKEETWLFFQGVDIEAKEKIAKELGKIIFGSNQKNNFISISLSCFSSTRADSTDQDCRNKRSRDEQSCSYIERFAEAVSNNPHRVFLVEDVEQADYCSQMGFKRAIERGKITKASGEEIGLNDAIIILSCETFSSRSRACSPSTKQKTENDNKNKNNSHKEEDQKGDDGAIMEELISPCLSLDLNISIDDDDSVDEVQSIDDIGLVESVDRRIVFKNQEL
ncbi:protein SMAX1-LIKE 3 [Mercurialis annua]|uniref:protein SMAX1-LIKE 3 n=1 Tax=Mercurialis annua TaxID=3986 RepID=UPI0021601537|nr:protein SMAX1-LIKE 3 [Mercurialis annua]